RRVDAAAADEPVLEFERNTGVPPDGPEDFDRLRGDLRADAVAGQNGNPVRRHLGAELFRALSRRLHEAVDRVQVGAGAGLDHVRRRALAGYDRPIEVDLHRHLADGILARGGRADRVVLQPTLHTGDGIDRRQHRVDGAVADPGVLIRLAV